MRLLDGPFLFVEDSGVHPSFSVDFGMGCFVVLSVRALEKYRSEESLQGELHLSEVQ